MSRDPRYDILFEPVSLGPVTAKNRFYQVPHCSGMGFALPRELARMRELKAEGGWGVVNTEYCSIHPTCDDSPYPYQRLWDTQDVRNNALMTEAVHRHGALAGVELWHGGDRNTNPSTRLPTLGLANRPSSFYDPVQSRRMDRRDIRELRAWHAAAAKRAQQAGFDIVYVYATHGYLLSQFLSTVTNTRTDEYGGSVENRTRIVRELLTETREAVGEHCAVALRLSVAAGGDDPDLPGLEAHQAIIESIGDLADVWDLTVDDYGVEMGHSRFQGEASLSPFVAYVRDLTDKPIVTVGRFTSPDTMVAQIRNGVADFIGAARPSIADPFLPAKIEQGRLDDIRECIGCNICYANNSMSVRLRCTQNPTMGEEWRLGWHPERIPSKSSDDTVLIVGAGLEAARALGERGYAVTLAETDRECGGRVTREARLPGLSEWARVRDYRLSQLLNLANVDVYRASHLSADDVLEFGFSSVLIATGATWRRDGLGRWHASTASIALPPRSTFTPDDIMAGKLPEGRVLLFDDDHYYMGSVLEERLVENGNAVVFVTPATMVAAWGRNTNEQYLSQRRLIELGVELCLGKVLTGFEDGVAHIDCVYSGNASTLEADAVLCVTSRAPDDALFIALDAERGALEARGIRQLQRIGDCLAPGTIAAAVYSGHRATRELGETA